MSKRFRVLAVCGLIGLMALWQHIHAPPRPPIFADLDFESAQARASASTPPRLLVLDFTAPGCAPCQEMDRRTWTYPGLTDWLEQNAVTIRIDAATDRGRARAFGITDVPTVIVLDNGREVARLGGQRTAQDLLARFKPLTARPSKH